MTTFRVHEHNPWTEEPGGLQSMGLQRAVHDLVTEQQQWKIRTLGFEQAFGLWFLW